jgi:hypothetical protein
MSGKGKILILTASHLCRNPRVVKEANTLGAAGYDVTVMSVSVQERFERIDLELMRGQPFQRQVIDYAAKDISAQTMDFVQRSATWSARLLCRTLKIELAQSLGPASALLRFARSHPADLTIAHTEIPIWAAQYLIRDGRRVAVDVEDWYSQDLLFADRQNRPLRLLRDAEDFVLNHAAYASATSDSMADALAESYRCPLPITVRNTFPLQTQSRMDRPASDGPPGFIWSCFFPLGSRLKTAVGSICWVMYGRVIGPICFPAFRPNGARISASFRWSLPTNSRSSWPSSISGWPSNRTGPAIGTSRLPIKSSSI